MFAHISKIITLGVSIEFLERVADYFWGSGDGKISVYYLNELFTSFQLFLLILIILILLKSIVLKVESRSKFLMPSLFLLAFFMIGFLISEYLIRLIYPKVNLLELTGRIPSEMPVKSWALIDGYAAYCAIPGIYENSENKKKTVNKQGFISTPDTDYLKNNNSIRIAFFGGSSTAGTGYVLSDEETWPYKVIQNLKQKFPSKRIDYINAALGGYTTFESYGRFWSRISHFNPDIVIFNHAWNDMYYFEFSDSINLWKSGLGEWSFSNKQKRITYPPFIIDKFIAWSQLLSKLRIRFQISRQSKQGEITFRSKTELKNYFNTNGLNIYRQNLKLIANTSATFKTKLFVCQQPTLIVEGLAEKDRKKCGYGLHGFNHQSHVKAFEEMYKIIENEIAPQSIINLTSMSGNSELFYDHIHPTDKGTSEYAKIVADSLSSYIFSEIK